MSDELPHQSRDQVKPLSLESAIIDVAPRVSGEPAKHGSTPDARTARPSPLGRLNLKDQS